MPRGNSGRMLAFMEVPIHIPVYSSVAASAPGSPGFSGDVLGLILQSGPMALFVLLVLGGFSILSWAVMFERFRSISRAEREDVEMLRRIRSQASLTDLRDQCERLPFSPMAHVYRAGFRELTRASGTAAPGDPSLRMAERSMAAASSEAVATLERFLNVLASTAAATPFIGLFGTVWGIMSAFRSIGVVGTASLATVAPGISEALITTAAGLAAAIPAVLGYNYFNNRLRGVSNRLDNFIAEVLNHFEKAA